MFSNFFHWLKECLSLWCSKWCIYSLYFCIFLKHQLSIRQNTEIRKACRVVRNSILSRLSHTILSFFYLFIYSIVFIYFLVLFVVFVCVVLVIVAFVLILVLLKCCHRLFWTFFAFFPSGMPKKPKGGNEFILSHSLFKKWSSLFFLCYDSSIRKNEQFHYTSFVAYLFSVTGRHGLFTFWKMNMK